eukprot:TRINITY_DN8872_c0_g1_i1.p1 TRINITY_DN8872_c0_g1~~TRINITY_DN8872_c0_g1_i1.p1  ORF type:complete len:535 (+),score=156.38 TRINITY_DN8872_c0_g1_i1:305-1909(+)
MAAPPLPSAVMVKLYGIEEQVLPTTVKLQLLNAISLLQGAEQRKARGLAGRLEEPARLLAALSLASSQYASDSATGDETEALQSLLDCGMRSFFARLSLAGSRGSNGAFAPMHGMFASTTSNKLDVDGVLAEDAKRRASAVPSENEPASAEAAPLWLLPGVRHCYEQVFCNEIRAAATAISDMHTAFRQAVSALGDLDKSSKYALLPDSALLDWQDGRAVTEQGDGSSSSRSMCGFDGVHEQIAELVRLQEQSLLPPIAMELIENAERAVGDMGSQLSMDVFNQAMASLREVVRADSLMLVAEQVALGLVAGDKEEKAHALLPNGARLDSDDMDALQSALSCTLGVVLARMMSEERKTRYSNAVTAHGARPATTPATQGIGAMVEKLLTVVSSCEGGAQSLFPDLDAREGCFAASKYRDILVARKAELTALMEMMSQVQGLKRTIVDAQPAPMSPLPPPKRAALRSAAHLALKCNAALSSRSDNARSDRARGGVAEFRKALSVGTEATECSDGDEQASPSLETNEFTGNRVLVI